MGYQWPHDDWRSRAAFYGDPSRGECESQLVWVKPPFQMYYGGKPINPKGFRFHKKAAPAMLEVLNDIWEKCGRSQKRVDEAGVSDFNGSYNHRKIRGREHEANAWSNHAYGSAIDLNAKANGLGNAHGTMPAFVVKAFEDRGFKWGGRYSGRKDPMHFEAVDNGRSAKPLGFITEPEPDLDEPATVEDADNGSDIVDAPKVTETAVVETETIKPDGTVKRWWDKASNWVLTVLPTLGLGGLGSSFAGAETTTIAIVVGALLIVFLVVWFTRKDKGW